MARAVILYFSGTGNTKTVAERLGDALGAKGFDVEVVSVEERDRLAGMNLSHCLVGVGFPCYAFDYPSILRDVFARMEPLPTPAPAFVFSTMGWSSGHSRRRLAKVLRRLNLHTIVTRGFVCPNNGWITLFTPGHPLARATRFERRLPERIAAFADDIIRSLAAFKLKPYCVCLWEWLAPIRFFLQRLEGLLMRDPHVEREKCRRCMQCVKHCPDGNIYVDADGAIAFRRPNGCLKCLRCISDCPADAVLFGKFTKGKGRYTKKARQAYLGRVFGGP